MSNLTKRVVLLIGAAFFLAGWTATVSAGIIQNPDENTLWLEDFSTIEINENRHEGWWHFNQTSAEGTDGYLRLRETGPRNYGIFQRYVPYDFRKESTYRWLQIKMGAVEDSKHFITLGNASTGGIVMGQPFTGITTFDLSPQPFAGKKASFALTLMHRGNAGTEPGGWLDVDWIRMVKVPYDGLTMMLIKRTGADEGRDNIAEIGDSILFRYYGKTVLPAGDVNVKVYIVNGMVPFCLSGEEIILNDRGKGGDKTVGDGIFSKAVTIDESAFSYTGKQSGELVATAEIMGTSSTHALSCFLLDIKTAHNIQSVVEASTPMAREYRTLWLERTKGENIARGRPVRFSVTPDYRLTQDGKDTYDLTDGKLSSRTDDRIWFDRDSTGWSSGAAMGVKLLVDLGEVYPIEKVVIRTLGGGEQGSLLFPEKLSLVVSEDGKEFFETASLQKLQLGEKDQAGDEGVFYLPEEGQSYVYPIAFENLRTKARYVGLCIKGTSDFVFADEVAIIRGAFPSEEVKYNGEKRTSFIMKGIEFAPFHGVFAVSSNIITPNIFFYADMRDEKDRKEKPSFVFELPEAITLLETQGTIKSEKTQRDGKPYIRWTVSGLSFPRTNSMGELYFRLDNKGIQKGDRAYMYAESPGYVPNETAFPIRVVDIPEVPKLKNLHISLAWMGEVYALRWPEFFSAWKHLGFNAVSTFPRYWKDGKPSNEVSSFLAEARKQGMKVIYNESPFHVMLNRHRKEGEIYSQMPSGPSKNLCPSYRGQFYQEEIERVGKLAGAAEPDYIFHDIECWYNGAREAAACTRCSELQKRSGKRMDDLLSDLGVEMIRDMNKAVKEGMGRASRPVTGIYAVDFTHAANPYAFVFDFKKLYPEQIDLAMPSLYIRGSAVTVQKRIRGNYEFGGKKMSVIPWLSAGTYGEFEPYKMEQIVLESLLNGAAGITYYWFGDFDSPMDYYYHAKALKTVAPYERLLVEGELKEVEYDNNSLFYTAWGTDREMLLLVGNYQNSRQTVTNIKLPFSRKIKGIKEIRDGKNLSPSKMLKEDVSPQEIKLYYIQTE
jgi:hypothetical protein